MPLDVLIVDTHRALAEALAMAIQATGELTCVGVATDADDALHQMEVRSVDVVVISAASSDDLHDARRLHEARDRPVVVLAESVDRQLVHDADRAGVAALVSKESSVDDVAAAIRSAPGGRLVLDGTTVLRLLDQPAPPLDPSELAVGDGGLIEPLTPRECDVLALLGEGMDPQQIAKELIMSVHTARGHVKNIMMKLGAHTQLQAVVYAARRGLLPQLMARSA